MYCIELIWLRVAVWSYPPSWNLTLPLCLWLIGAPVEFCLFKDLNYFYYAER